MHGPSQLTNINLYVNRTSPGVYILSRDGKVAHYVGRSDTDVAIRIVNKAREDERYRYFWFEYTTSSMRAYYIECEWYHKYLPPDNINHPAAPPGSFWRCPVPDCPWS